MKINKENLEQDLRIGIIFVLIILGSGLFALLLFYLFKHETLAIMVITSFFLVALVLIIYHRYILPESK